MGYYQINKWLPLTGFVMLYSRMLVGGLPKTYFKINMNTIFCICVTILFRKGYKIISYLNVKKKIIKEEIHILMIVSLLITNALTVLDKVYVKLLDNVFYREKFKEN